MSLQATFARGGAPRGRAAVRLWLAAIALLVAAMVLVGGATRLTDSGLSITEWQPLLGAIPPLNEGDWEAAFARYRETTEYKVVNRDMTLSAFKPIYWWEWSHRFLGRFIGVAFLVPFLAFLATGGIDRRMAWRIGPLFLLGGLQGAIGWWMVTSGLAERTDVSALRLAVHLTLACVILAVAVRLAIDPDGARPARTGRGARWSAVLVAALFVQIFLGGLVAGLDAGQGFNTWPLMDGRLVPPGLAVLDPAWRNLFENAATVQFLHRTFAFVVATLALVAAWRLIGDGRTRLGLLLGTSVLVQFALGVATLLAGVPMALALLHQGTALVLVAVAVAATMGARNHARRTGLAAPLVVA